MCNFWYATISLMRLLPASLLTGPGAASATRSRSLPGSPQRRSFNVQIVAYPFTHVRTSGAVSTMLQTSPRVANRVDQTRLSVAPLTHTHSPRIKSGFCFWASSPKEITPKIATCELVFPMSPMSELQKTPSPLYASLEFAHANPGLQRHAHRLVGALLQDRGEGTFRRFPFWAPFRSRAHGHARSRWQ